ncbi:hypothetical protein GQ53DRAFT_814930 [Thozetella sp. PMI_491]|nr:hypothetical protein GQ53DRAFT_814930 [Thozetella sp. PMI_491]
MRAVSKHQRGKDYSRSELQPCERTVFLTGATGFVGKVVLEELMRRRQELGIRKVAVLVRPTKPSKQATPIATQDTSAASRFHQEIASSRCFANLPPNWTDSVQPYSGDLEKPRCGLDASAYDQLCRETTHIIHCAACVQFDLPLAEAMKINVHGTLNVLQLAGACSQLQHMVYTSTAYVSPVNGEEPIPEELAPLGRWTSAQELLHDFKSGIATEEDVLRETQQPNTYSVSKSIAEHLVVKSRGKVPVTITRPSIITPSMERPFPGWTDSVTALVAIVMATHGGGVYAIEGRPNRVADLVPVDFVTDFLIDEAFTSTPPVSSVSILNCVSGTKCVETTTFAKDDAAYFQHAEARYLHYTSSYLARLSRFLWQTLPLKSFQLLSWLSRDRHGVQQTTRALQGLNKLDKTFAYYQSYSFPFVSSRRTLFERVPTFEGHSYMRTVFRGTQLYMIRRARERDQVSTEKLIGGRELRGSMGIPKLFLTSRANFFYRFVAVLVEFALGRMFQKVAFDQQSFFNSMSDYLQNPGEENLLILPSHRSYLDFVLLPYLIYHFPGLGIRMPRIAAQSDFARLPILGPVLKRLGAFFVHRGVGCPDPQMDEEIRQLVEQREHILFFPEGQRSRSRKFLAPRRGLLRSLQGTGKSFKVLPISISYERVPEEGQFIQEAQGNERSRMTIWGFLVWTYKMLRGRLKLGRVHIKCGKILDFTPKTDVHCLLQEVMSELQKNTVVTTYHLGSYEHSRRHLSLLCPPYQPLEEKCIKTGPIRDELEKRGATVLEGSLLVDERHPVPPILESSLQNQWAHFMERNALDQQSGTKV